MNDLLMLLPITVCIGLIIWVQWLRIPGNGGIVGQKVRESDHWAWEMAVEDARKEIERLQKARRYTEQREAEQFLRELLEHEPKV